MKSVWDLRAQSEKSAFEIASPSVTFIVTVQIFVAIAQVLTFNFTGKQGLKPRPSHQICAFAGMVFVEDFNVIVLLRGMLQLLNNLAGHYRTLCNGNGKLVMVVGNGN